MSRIENFIARVRNLPGVRQWDHRRYRSIFANSCRTNLFYGVYPSFEAARADFPDTKPAGYDNEAAATMYGGVEQQIRLTDYPSVHWLSRILPGSRRLFDYGGHIGTRFYAFAPYLQLPQDFTWTVCDLPAVIREGRRIAEQNGISGLEFTADPDDAAKTDIFFASGSLQYFEEHLVDTLRRIGTRPRHLLINGCPLHDRHEFVTINNMTTAFCTYKVFRKQPFLDRFADDGYELLDLWEYPSTKRCDVPFHEDYNGAVYHGMYLVDSGSK